ncbi:hypothetical protein [Psychrobacter sp. JCM 18900]|uniref:hypothetical protein n=1 Tax=Psychrobacter sp. JCM 18900 TaxID=1298608 RepID=UPI0004B4E3E8|nr:hypothetical protein [Psychrobacter sp. JCM 18900]
MKATIYTIIALIAFAANSLFCRMALAEGYIDAWSFTIIRLMSATACLGIIMLYMLTDCDAKRPIIITLLFTLF